MIKINVITNNINWLSYIKNPNSYISRKIDKINKKSNYFINNKIFCTLLLSGNREIKNLNKKFRKKNKITDVLSFPFHTKKALKKKLKIYEEVYLGDIIINLNELKNKKTLNKFKKEFDKLWIHGLVHLFGHDHKKKKDFTKMAQVENKYFKIINV